MKKLIFFLFLLAIVGLLVWSKDSQEQEGCGKWIKPIYEKYRVGDYHPHKYMWVLFKVHQDSIPDSVFVPIKLMPSDTACWHWEEVWEMDVRPSNWAEYLWRPPNDSIVELLFDTLWFHVRRKVYEPCE